MAVLAAALGCLLVVAGALAGVGLHPTTAESTAHLCHFVTARVIRHDARWPSPRASASIAAQRATTAATIAAAQACTPKRAPRTVGRRR